MQDGWVQDQSANGAAPANEPVRAIASNTSSWSRVKRGPRGIGERIHVLVAALATRGACAELNARVLAVHEYAVDDAFRADVLVTGDEDLLVVHPWKGVPILRPREFWLMDRTASG